MGSIKIFTDEYEEAYKAEAKEILLDRSRAECISLEIERLKKELSKIENKRHRWCEPEIASMSSIRMNDLWSSVEKSLTSCE